MVEMKNVDRLQMCLQKVENEGELCVCAAVAFPVKIRTREGDKVKKHSMTFELGKIFITYNRRY